MSIYLKCALSGCDELANMKCLCKVDPVFVCKGHLADHISENPFVQHSASSILIPLDKRDLEAIRSAISSYRKDLSTRIKNCLEENKQEVSSLLGRIQESNKKCKEEIELLINRSRRAKELFIELNDSKNLPTDSKSDLASELAKLKQEKSLEKERIEEFLNLGASIDYSEVKAKIIIDIDTTTHQAICNSVYEDISQKNLYNSLGDISISSLSDDDQDDYINATPQAMCISNCENYLIIGYRTKIISLWSIKTGEVLDSVKDIYNGTSSIEFSNSGKCFYFGNSCSEFEKYFIENNMLHRDASFQKKNQMDRIACNIGIFVLSSCDKYAITTNEINIYIWNLNTKGIINYFTSSQGNVSSLAISNNGKFIACGYLNSGLSIWSFHEKQEIKMFNGHQKAVTCVKFSLSDTVLVSSDLDSTINVWNIETGEQIQQISCSHNTRVSPISTNQSRKHTRAMPKKPSYHLATPVCVNSQPSMFLSGAHNSYMDISQCENVVFSLTNDYCVRAWNIKSGEEINTFRFEKQTAKANPDPRGEVQDSFVKLSKSGRLLLGNCLGNIRIWRLT